eukprot:2727766-Pyramimonas_sp.AAC.1
MSSGPTPDRIISKVALSPMRFKETWIHNEQDHTPGASILLWKRIHFACSSITHDPVRNRIPVEVDPPLMEHIQAESFLDRN